VTKIIKRSNLAMLRFSKARNLLLAADLILWNDSAGTIVATLFKRLPSVFIVFLLVLSGFVSGKKVNLSPIGWLNRKETERK